MRDTLWLLRKTDPGRSSSLRSKPFLPAESSPQSLSLVEVRDDPKFQKALFYHSLRPGSEVVLKDPDRIQAR
ncbi:hypothetical protein STEG23_017850 [Scotinomys teguina]